RSPSGPRPACATSRSTPARRSSLSTQSRRPTTTSPRSCCATRSVRSCPHSHAISRQRSRSACMKVPLLVNDFLDRAETVFRDRVGVIDEPDAADTLGSLTYGEVAHRVRALQAGLDELGVDVGERVAVVSPNAARLLELFYAVPTSGRVLVPINFRLKLEEVEYIVDHSG